MNMQLSQDELKKQVGIAAIKYVKSGIIGVGTGSTANFFIDALGEIKNKIDGAVASSKTTADKLKAKGIEVFDLNDIDQLNKELAYTSNLTIQHEYTITLFIDKETKFLLNSLKHIFCGSVILLLIVIAAFFFTIKFIFNQKRTSEIKTDFINNMTHELKTPISTIGLASEALLDSDLTKNEQTKNKFVSTIIEENKRLSSLVENVLQSAVSDKQTLEL